MKKTIVALSMLTVVFVSCKKDDKDEQIAPTIANLTGSYKVTAATAAGTNVFNNSNEGLNQFESCERDDVYTLNADLTAVRTDAGTQCDPVNNGAGTWNLTNSTTISLTEVFSTVDVEGTIKSWNGKTLVVEEDNGMYVVSVTLQKQ
jgi:hypothetical protein